MFSLLLKDLNFLLLLICSGVEPQNFVCTVIRLKNSFKAISTVSYFCPIKCIGFFIVSNNLYASVTVKYLLESNKLLHAAVLVW